MHARHVFALSLSLLVCATALPGQRGDRSYTAGRFALEMDGKMIGFVSELTGGNATSTVVNERPGPDFIVHKHIAGVKYEPIVLDATPDEVEAVLPTLLDSRIRRINGAVITADNNFKEISRLNFFNALITAVTIPELNAAGKDACHFDIELTPEYTRSAAGQGGEIKRDVPIKKCLVSGYRVAIDNLPTTRVAKIDAFTLRRAVVENPVGEQRDYQKGPAPLAIPNIKLTISEADIKEWAVWLEDFVVKGNNGQDKEKTLTLEILNPITKDALLTLSASGVGIIALRPVPAAAGIDAIRRFEVELYVETWTLGASKRAGLDGSSPRGLVGAGAKPGRN